MTLDIRPYVHPGHNVLAVWNVHSSWHDPVSAEISFTRDLSPWGNASAFTPDHPEQQPINTPWYNIAVLLVGYILLFAIVGSVLCLRKSPFNILNTSLLSWARHI